MSLTRHGMGDAALPAGMRQRVLSASRIRLRVVAFAVLLVAGLTAFIFALVGEIFDELTPAVRNDLRWKVEHGVSELSHAGELGVILRDAELLERAAHEYLRDREVVGLVALDGGGKVIFSHHTVPLPHQLFWGKPGVAVELGRRLITCWTPVRVESSIVGRIGLVLTTERLRAGDALRRNILRAAVVGSFVALLASVAFVALYIAPILKVTRSAFLKLEETTQAALEAARVKGEFLANMSHEIRTPLNGIIGMLSLLLRTELPKKSRRYAELSYASAASLFTVVNDVLDFSKLEAGRYEIRPLECDIHALMQEVVEPLVARAQERGLEVLLRVAPEVPQWVEIDGARVRQVISNLLSNAVKFTERGEVVLSLELSKREQDTVGLRFVVRDTGIGIARSDQALLFRSFAQIDGSLTRRHGGTGLGLAISKHLVERMGGQIGVTSEVGVGSSFWVELPAREVMASTARVRPMQGVDRRILLVSASPTSRQLLTEQIEHWGMRVEAAEAWDDALHRHRRAQTQGAPFDVVLADLGASFGAAQISAQDEALLALRGPAGAPGPAIVLLAPVLHTPTRRERQAAAILHPKPPRMSELYDLLVGSGGGRTTSTDDAGAQAGGAASPAPRLGHVLIVEDNLINRELVTELLDRLNYSWEAADDGAAAVGAFTPGKFDAVLMDCQMPNVDGYEATRKVRALECGQSHTPIIALTAHALAEERSRAASAGMDAYLTKPVSERALSDALLRWTSRAQALPQIGRAPAPDVPALPPLTALEQVPLLTGKELSLSLIQLFLEHVPKQLEALRSEASRVLDQAHKLRGTCGAIGARRMMLACADLERRARAGDTLDLEREVTTLRALFEQTARALGGREGVRAPPQGPRSEVALEHQAGRVK